MSDPRPKTLFLDIDAVLLMQHGNLSDQLLCTPRLLPGVRAKFADWDRKGYRLILTTGRRESMREVTERQLTAVGLYWDQLVMGLGGGPRVLVNNWKTSDPELVTASAVMVEPNVGIVSLEL